MASATPTILLLEDHPDTCSMMRWALEQAGYVVLTAKDGNAAFRLCVQQEQTIDLLIADVLVPGINGVDLVQVVQAKRPDMRVLLCSGEYRSIKASLASLKPDTPFLKKPFDPDTLLMRVRQVLGEPQAQDASTTKAHTAAGREPTGVTSPKAPTVLLVEDDKTTLMALTKLLKQHGYHVVAARSGEEALDCWSQQPIDVLVTDVVMPKMSGTDLARRLRASKSDLPILYISGMVAEAGTLSPNPWRETFLAKPVTAQQLGTKIQRLLHDA